MNADIRTAHRAAAPRLGRARRQAARARRRASSRCGPSTTRLEAARQQVAAAHEHLTDNQTARREIEKQVAVHQGRLSKFRDQLMSVKTNIEYQAMQKEIEFAQNEVKVLEDKILERMLEADDLTAAVKRTEAALAAEQKSRRRRPPRARGGTWRSSSESSSELRQRTRPPSWRPRPAGARHVRTRSRGAARAWRWREAREGICTICHVRLRPQVFNTFRATKKSSSATAASASSTSSPAVRPATPRHSIRMSSPSVQPAS